MAKRNSTRPKARKPRRKAQKPKFINVEGHQLTESQYADYERCLESRSRTNAGAKAGHILSMGLSDFLNRYRPSTKVKGQLSEICHDVTRVGLAVGVMDGYTFYSAGPAVIRSAGCKLLKELALELYYASAKLTAVAMNVEAEETTKLHDWIAMDDKVTQIGRAVEVAHGNR